MARIFYVKIHNKTEIVEHTIIYISLGNLFLNEFVFVKYFKLSNFRLLNGQLIILIKTYHAAVSNTVIRPVLDVAMVTFYRGHC